MEEFLARKHPVNRRKSLTVLVNGVSHFCQNGMKRNDKKYSKKLPFYGRTMERYSELHFVSYFISNVFVAYCILFLYL